MWNGMFSPNLRKSSDFLATDNHTESPYYEVTEVLDGFATVVVHFNHTCEYHGKTYEPASNGIAYQYEYEVGGMDEVEAQKELETILGDNPSPKEIIDLLDTVDVIV